MNKRGRNTPSESPNFSLSLVGVFSGDSAFSWHRQPQQLCHGGWGSSVRLIESGTVADESSQRGVQEWGQSPTVSCSLSPSFSISQVQMHIHLLWSFGLLLFPHYDLPLPVCLPLSPSLCQFPSIFVSLALSFPTARPSFILIPLPSLGFLLSAFFFFI